jgi:hypothetical protein
MERITQTQLANAQRHLNDLLPDDTFVQIQGENGGTSLYHCYRTPEGKGGVSRTLVHGTKREVFDFIRAMREGILLSQGR